MVPFNSNKIDMHAALEEVAPQSEFLRGLYSQADLAK